MKTPSRAGICPPGRAPVDKVLLVKCPEPGCEAAPYWKCTKTKGDQVIPRSTVHKARRRAAQDAGLVQRRGG